MDLEFTVTNQILKKVETEEELELYNYNYNQYNCIFTFNNDENSLWNDVDKFVIFRDSWDNTCTVHLGEEDTCECLIPSSMLNGNYFRIAIYGGDLVSTNSVSIPLLMSGYIDPNNPDYIHSWVYGVQKDIFVEIFNHINTTLNSISYEDKCLNLYSKNGLIESIYLPFVTEAETSTIARHVAEEYFGNLQLSEVAWSGDYEDLLNVPSEFTPKHHEHMIVDVVDYDDNIDIDLNTLLDLLGDEIAKE